MRSDCAPGVRAGPRPTAEEVTRDYRRLVFDLARHLLGNEADAEDVTQEVMLLVVRKLSTLRNDAHLGAWLRRVTANAASTFRRRRTSRREVPVPCHWDDLPQECTAALEPGQRAVDDELRRLLRQAVAGLPPIYRDVLVLADLEGLAYAEAGERLGLTLPVVKSRLHRARSRLREVMASHFAA